MQTPTLEQAPKMLQSLLNRFGAFEEKFSKVSSPSFKPIEVPIGIAEASKYLGRSNQTLYKDVQSGTIPYYKKGGKLYFLKSELLEWVKSGKIKTNIELSEDVDNALSK